MIDYHSVTDENEQTKRIHPIKYLLILIGAATIGLLSLKSTTKAAPNSPPTTQHHHRSLEITPLQKGAVAVLVAANQEDLLDFCLLLKSLSKNDIVTRKTPLLVFHEGDLSRNQKIEVLKCTDSTVSFNTVDLSFPFEFDADLAIEKGSEAVAAEGTVQRSGRQRWGYARMIRFWTTQIWKDAVVRKFDTIMRLDTDSCFVAKGKEDSEDEYFPSMRDRYVYRSDGLGVGVNAFIESLYEFAVTYMMEERITPANPDLWGIIQNTWDQNKTLPIFFKNFEISKVSFFQSAPVMKWHEALTDGQPYGVFRYRWSDAQTRVFTLAMFANADSIYYNKHPGYRHGKGICRKYFNWM